MSLNTIQVNLQSNSTLYMGGAEMSAIILTEIVSFIKKNPTRCNNVSKFYYSIFIWSSKCFGWHRPSSGPKIALMMGGVSSETCWASYKYGITKFWYIVAFCWIFLFHTWKVDGRVVGGRDNVHQLHVQQPSTCEKPVVASAILRSWWYAVCHPKHVELHINME